MVDVTPKENWLRAVRGEMPVHIPQYYLGWKKPLGWDELRGINCSAVKDGSRGPMGGVDAWGVTYVANEETGYAALPEPNNFILEDIDDWEKVVHAPAPPEVDDWEALAKKDYEASGINRDESAVCISTGFSPFMSLVGFMGFNEGLCAIIESPDSVRDMLNYMADYYVPLVEKYIEYYKPDILSMGDDICSKYNPFFSHDALEEVFLPIYRRLAKPATDRGIPIHWHICGRCEDYYQDLYDLGVRSTDPAQESNDLNNVKKAFERRLLLCGGFDWVPPDNWPNVTEGEIKEMVRYHIDKYAANGGFAWAGNALGRYGDETIAKVNVWIDEEVYEYGRFYYDKHC